MSGQSQKQKKQKLVPRILVTTSSYRYLNCTMEIKLHWAQQPFYKQPNKRFSSYLKCLLPEITDHFSLFLPLCKPPYIRWLNCYQSPSSAMKENQERLKKKMTRLFHQNLKAEAR